MKNARLNYRAPLDAGIAFCYISDVVGPAPVRPDVDMAAYGAMKASLYVFSGLPGTGKTILSQRLANQIKAVHLRIDTVEQALRDLCGIAVES